MDVPQSILVAVIDDEESVRRALQRLLRSAGLRVETYGSGREFLESLADHRPDCALLDLHMPVIDGFEVLAQLAKAAAPVPTVIMTGHDTPEARQRTAGEGAGEFLRKPMDSQTLLDAIAKAVAKPAA